MNYLQAAGIVVASLIPFFIPGIFLVRFGSRKSLSVNAARVVAVSFSVNTLVALVAAAFGLPLWIILAADAVIAAMVMWKNRRQFFTSLQLWQIMSFVTAFILIFAAFSIPYLTKHDGLPTGDSQKAIVWAQRMVANEGLPDYAASPQLLNRDPGDFFTPGLHALTAFVMSLSAEPLMTVGFFSVAVGVGIALVGAAIAYELAEEDSKAWMPALAVLFVLTNFRFLRYLREPGYHLQNAVGELLLYAMVLFGFRLVRKWQPLDAAIFVSCGLALAASHQFSVFMAVFILVPIGLAYCFDQPETLSVLMRQSTAAKVSFIVVLVAAAAVAIVLGVPAKVPHLFTDDPHLISQVPPLSAYPLTLGPFWFFSGLAGLILMGARLRRTASQYRHHLTFIAVVIALLLLSQGPRLGIDIPPVRALFYAVVPLSIAAAYFFSQMLKYVRTQHSRTARVIYSVLLLLAVAVPAVSSVYQSDATSAHTVRTNSTLTAQQRTLAQALSQVTAEQDGVLVDDYNRRSSSWLVLSGKPMFTRIAADLARQMDEAGQSAVRHELYLRQLDYEKIFSLGSRPEIITLFNKQDIGWVTGIRGSSETAFRSNPALAAVLAAADITIFRPLTSAACRDDLCRFYMRASTLVNDIGDDEDTYEHLPASIRASRLSAPQRTEQTNWRSTSSPIIPLAFNVGDFTRILWDKENTGYADTALEFVIEFTSQPDGLALVTASGMSYDISDRKTVIRISPNEVPFDAKGFIILNLLNPAEELVNINLIALGLARVP